MQASHSGSTHQEGLELNSVGQQLSAEHKEAADQSRLSSSASASPQRPTRDVWRLAKQQIPFKDVQKATKDQLKPFVLVMQARISVHNWGIHQALKRSESVDDRMAKLQVDKDFLEAANKRLASEQGPDAVSEQLPVTPSRLKMALASCAAGVGSFCTDTIPTAVKATGRGIKAAGGVFKDGLIGAGIKAVDFPGHVLAMGVGYGANGLVQAFPIDGEPLPQVMYKNVASVTGPEAAQVIVGAVDVINVTMVPSGLQSASQAIQGAFTRRKDNAAIAAATQVPGGDLRRVAVEEVASASSSEYVPPALQTNNAANDATVSLSSAAEPGSSPDQGHQKAAVEPAPAPAPAPATQETVTVVVDVPGADTDDGEHKAEETAASEAHAFDSTPETQPLLVREDAEVKLSEASDQPQQQPAEKLPTRQVWRGWNSFNVGTAFDVGSSFLAAYVIKQFNTFGFMQDVSPEQQSIAAESAQLAMKVVAGRMLQGFVNSAALSAVKRSGLFSRVLTRQEPVALETYQAAMTKRN